MVKKIFAFAACAALLSCGNKTHRMSIPAMGTLFSIMVKCGDAQASRIYEQVSEEIKRIESLLSQYNEGSDIYALNSSVSPVMVSPETSDMLKRSVLVSQRTGGRFDITFAPLGELWNYKNKNFAPPSAHAAAAARSLVDYRGIRFHKNGAVSLSKPGMKVGLGGIAKGYAAERAVQIMELANAESGMADAGGNIKVFGRAPSGDSWNIGVRHPREDSVICSVKLESGDAVSTSGDYERFALYKGKRYHHIIDPLTGSPAETFASVSIICNDAELADAYSTAVFVMGMERARDFLKENPALSAIIIDLQMRIHASANLKDRLEAYSNSVDWM
jgi:thiamine biosynthesis lipoprotein